MQALSHLFSTAGLDVEDQVAVFTKPVRKVKATSPADIGAVVLLPEGSRVETTPRGQAATAGAIEVKFVPEDSLHKYYILPSTATDSVAPLWFVGTTPDEERANMAWSSITVQTIVGHDFTGALKPNGCRPNAPDRAESPAEGKNEAKGQAKAAAKTEAKGTAAAKKEAKSKAAAKKDAKSKASADSVGDQDSDENEALPPVELATSVRMVMPYLLNTKKLNKGDELLVFKASESAAPKRARDVEPIRLADLVKKTRV